MSQRTAHWWMHVARSAGGLAAGSVLLCCASSGNVALRRPRLIEAGACAPAPQRSDRDCAQALFEVLVGADGRVRIEDTRLLGLEPVDAGVQEIATLRLAIAALNWHAARDAGGRCHPDRALVRVACRGAAKQLVSRRDQRPLQPALRARAAAAAILGARPSARGAKAPAELAGLECVWADLDAFRQRTPFFYDALRDALQLDAAAARLRPGFWWCRFERTTHTGDFVLLDRGAQLLVHTSYSIGE